MGTYAPPIMPIKECGTPDAVYGFRSNGQRFEFDVCVPVTLLNPSEEANFFAEMHNAMLPVIERLYERRWKQCFANKKDKEGRPYPATYAELFKDKRP